VGGPPPSLALDLDGISLPTPILAASGCFNTGREMSQLVDVKRMGGIVTKSVTLGPTRGLHTPRMAEVTSGMLNAIGLQNSGLDAFMEKEAPWIGIEANISCPNVERRNQVFACHPDQAAEVVGAMSRLTSLPIFAKLTADVTDIVEVAEACIRAGAHGLSLINTLLGPAIDVETFRPRLGAVTGGLSGPAIHPIAVRCVYQVARAFPKVPIMGIGGVASARDAIELMLAGAWAVQVGTANFYEPEATIKIAEGVADFLARKGLSGPRDLVGRGRIRHGGTQSAGGAG
jgi:dihydroorotate dehydrogenase (NAD+) catalytic subunit